MLFDSEVEMDNVKISAFAKTVRRTQMSPVSSNLTNTVTVQTAENGPDESKDTMFAIASMESPYSNLLDKKSPLDAEDSEVMNVLEDQSPPRLQVDQGHPGANAQGYVAFPNVNVVKEMTDMITVTKAYEVSDGSEVHHKSYRF
jgi:flagellar basal-body rod protein FlgC